MADITVYPSDANFLLVQVASAAKTYKELLAKGIIVRNRHKDIPNTLRITIASAAENDLLLAAFGVAGANPQVQRAATVIHVPTKPRLLSKLIWIKLRQSKFILVLVSLIICLSNWVNMAVSA